MVILPALATEQADLIAELVEAGMDIARINCGHDGPEVWKELVAHVRSAAAAAGRDVRIAMDLAGPKIRIGALPSQPGVVDARPQLNRYGKLLQNARIMAVPMEGADAQSAGQAEEVQLDLLPIRNEGWQLLTIGDRLRARDSSGRWRELTLVDCPDGGLLLSCNQRCHFTSGLEFLQEGGPGKIVVGDLPAHADIVSYSFVSRAADIEALQQELERDGREYLAVILKIETRRAFLNLPELLLAAMRYSRPLGVMIAQGDLAIECGWEELGEIQEEILRICAAALIPCIWATQVLEEMARHGMPTRAEITDAAMAARAEAVMLNNGPNITATVRTLGAIVARFHPRQPESPRHREELLSCLAFRSKGPAVERQET